LRTLIEKHKHLSDDAQKQAGKAIAGDMGEEHTKFLKVITQLIESGAVNVSVPETFFNEDVRRTLTDEQRSAVDRATVNIADQLRRVYEFFRSKKTPDASPHLQTMIEHLWQMKERVEKKYGDVYKF
jgi:DNA-binding MarR family transcriptional regulator